MTIKDPCYFCATAYGHKAECPHENMFSAVPVDKRGEAVKRAQDEWKRGYDDASKQTPVSREDRMNAVYLLGRHYQELENSGRVPRRKTRQVRVPTKSEPRMTAVTSPATSS